MLHTAAGALLAAAAAVTTLAPTVLAQTPGQDGCLSLAGSTVCAGFQDSYISTWDLGPQYPFMNQVDDVSDFDNLGTSFFTATTSDSFRRSKMVQQLGCNQGSTANTAIRWERTVYCALWTQLAGSRTCTRRHVGAEGQRQICPDTCTQFGAAETALTSNTTFCPARDRSGTRASTLTTDLQACNNAAAAAGGPTCISGEMNEGNCGFGNWTAGLCMACGVANPDQCCYSAGVTQDQCGYILAASTYTTTGADGKPTSGGASSGSSSKKLSGGAIAGIVVGVVGGLLILGGLAFWFCCRRRKNNRTTNTKGGHVLMNQYEKEDATRTHDTHTGLVGNAAPAAANSTTASPPQTGTSRMANAAGTQALGDRGVAATGVPAAGVTGGHATGVTGAPATGITGGHASGVTGAPATGVTGGHATGSHKGAVAAGAGAAGLAAGAAAMHHHNKQQPAVPSGTIKPATASSPPRPLPTAPKASSPTAARTVGAPASPTTARNMTAGAPNVASNVPVGATSGVATGHGVNAPGVNAHHSGPGAGTVASAAAIPAAVAVASAAVAHNKSSHYGPGPVPAGAARAQSPNAPGHPIAQNYAQPQQNSAQPQQTYAQPQQNVQPPQAPYGNMPAGVPQPGAPQAPYAAGRPANPSQQSFTSAQSHQSYNTAPGTPGNVTPQGMPPTSGSSHGHGPAVGAGIAGAAVGAGAAAMAAKRHQQPTQARGPVPFAPPGPAVPAAHAAPGTAPTLAAPDQPQLAQAAPAAVAGVPDNGGVPPSQVPKVQDANGVWINRASEVVAVHPYTQSRGDELTLTPGLRLRVRELFDDGWATATVCAGQGPATGKRGLFPLVCVEAA